MINENFTILMSVYRNDRPEFLREAVESVTIRQTAIPNEVILVVDGPIPKELKCEIESLVSEIKTIRPLWKEQNEGLGMALRDGLLAAKNEIIARMDSDDIAVFDRFEKQLAMFEADEELGMVGSCISEFIDKPDNIVSHRIVPSTDKEIHNYIKKRCPFNHMTVMYKKSEVLKAGNYQDWYYNEDYFLWIRMMLAGCKFANLPDTLVKARVGADMYQRRGGCKYFKSEAKLQGYMLRHRLIGLPRYCYNVCGRFSVQVLMPNKLRGFVFRKLFRKQ